MHISRLFFFMVLCLSALVVSAQDSNDPKAAYNKIKFLDGMQDIKRSQEIAVFNWLSCTDECMELVKLRGALSTRAETEPLAAFYSGLLNLEDAQKLNGFTNPNRALVESFSKSARKNFVYSSESGIAAASWNMGIIYDTNLGVPGSKLAAIEWFGRAGHQYLSEGERETALAALEKIETLDPNHRESKRLRNALFPTRKSR